MVSSDNRRLKKISPRIVPGSKIIPLRVFSRWTAIDTCWTRNYPERWSQPLSLRPNSLLFIHSFSSIHWPFQRYLPLATKIGINVFFINRFNSGAYFTQQWNYKPWKNMRMYQVTMRYLENWRGFTHFSPIKTLKRSTCKIANLGLQLFM